MNDDNKTIKAKFPFFQDNNHITYLDSAATSLINIMSKNSINDYYEKFATNSHNNDSLFAQKTNDKINEVRNVVNRFIGNTNNPMQVIFTSSTTFAINQIAYGLQHFINKEDEILLTKLEHAANLLPWYNLAKNKDAKIKFIELEDFIINPDMIGQFVNEKTKIISFAHVTNVIGYTNDIETIVKSIRQINKNVIIVIDAAQSIAHVKTNVINWDIDFLVFSAHKMYGPTGIAVLWGKSFLLDQLTPFLLGGNMNDQISNDNPNFTYNVLPYKLEGGTPNTSAIFGLTEAIKFIESIGIENITQYENELKSYAVEKFQKHLADKVVIYNPKKEGSILTFNIKNRFSQDVAMHLSDVNNIIVRSGTHCSKLVFDLINEKTTIRASFSIYNNEEDIDKLVVALKNEHYFLGNII